jgi:hypothetical protein
MKSGLNLVIILIGFLLFWNCKNESNTKISNESSISNHVDDAPNLAQNEAGNIVNKAIQAAGGWKQWAHKKTLTYTKTIINYDSLGNTTRELNQLHQYQLQPTFKAIISWEENGDQYEILNNGKESWKLKNKKELTDESSKSSAWNSSFGSHYVMCMPFKLTDPGTILEYEGLDTLANNAIVHTIKTTYKKNAGSSGGMHTWWYYFDHETYNPIANFLDYGNGFSYTQYDAFIKTEGIGVNKQRSSYKTNHKGELMFKSTEYINTNIKFDEVIEPSVFEIKSSY